MKNIQELQNKRDAAISELYTYRDKVSSSRDKGLLREAKACARYALSAQIEFAKAMNDTGVRFEIRPCYDIHNMDELTGLIRTLNADNRDSIDIIKIAMDVFFEDLC